ncbi:nucleotide triphosphate diphosphatase NUDT15 [Streptomyces candidus]|uniref:8-oxo-dGTP pyrophosphatase MutT (NUDIX family) n=1 Tax=Streptomyces candidus TaxID=67283 RepID=A0A7X0HFC3_9ACTN|nr:NUDIX domain-containing protein [Streptomyces candidus]MBB6436599.1 8-oxo-dGTP pyrophosphatase MutT (NUDIX family) [Streptomyces candidus]
MSTVRPAATPGPAGASPVAASPAPGAVPDLPARTSPAPNSLVGVGVIVLDTAGRVLLGLAHNGAWELPGGKVDPGESFEQTAARELAEETGLSVSADTVRIAALVMDGAYGLNRISAAAVTRVTEGVARVMEPDKIARWEMFAPDEIPGTLFTPSAAVLRAWRPELALPPTDSYHYRMSDG